MKHATKGRYPWLVVVGGMLAIAGCGARTPTRPVVPVRNDSGSTVDQVCKIAAELFAVDRSKVNAETSLGDLGADELDFVELVMELEEHFDILIPDETAEGMMGANNYQQGMQNVTMAKLAAVVDRQIQMPRAGVQPSHPPEPAARPGGTP